MFFCSSSHIQAILFFFYVTSLLSKELIPFINNKIKKKRKKGKARSPAFMTQLSCLILPFIWRETLLPFVWKGKLRWVQFMTSLSQMRGCSCATQHEVIIALPWGRLTQVLTSPWLFLTSTAVWAMLLQHQLCYHIRCDNKCSAVPALYISISSRVQLLRYYQGCTVL